MARGLEIRRGFRPISNAELADVKFDVLERASRNYQEAIRANIRKAPLPGEGQGRGSVTGNLEDAVRIERPINGGIANNAGLVSFRVYIDQDSAPYAIWQELGTGVRSENPDSPRAIIVPKSGTWMHWTMVGYQPYRGKYIRSRLRKDTFYITREKVQRQYRSKGKVRTRTVFREKYVFQTESGKPEYDVFALQVLGVWPRYFFRDAVNDSELYREYRNDMARSIAAYFRGRR